MIQLYDMKPCADHFDSIQAEGQIAKEYFSLDRFEALLRHMGFKVFFIGNPKVMVCKRSDCLFLINWDGTFNISKVVSKEKLTQIIEEITFTYAI